MGVFENFEQELNKHKAEIIETMNEIIDKGIDEEVERLDIIVFPGDYEIVNIIMYSMNKEGEVLYKGRQFSGSVNLTGPLFLPKVEEYISKEEETKIKAQILCSLEKLFAEYAEKTNIPMQILFYKSAQAYDLKNKIWVIC